jgi:hypothetical protein
MRTPALAAALLLAACEGPLLHAELEVPDVRLTLPSQQLPGSTAAGVVPCAPGAPPPCAATELTFDVGAEVPVVNEPNVTYHLRLTSVAIRLAATSAGDLGGVESVRILVVDPRSGDATPVASYLRTDPTPREIRVAGTSDLDLRGHLQAGALRLRVELTFDRATPAFQADVETGYALDAKVDWGAYL